MAKKKGVVLPSKLKFKKPSKHTTIPEFNKLQYKGTVLRFGHYGIKAAADGFLTKSQIEATRIAMRRPLKRMGYKRSWVLVKPTTIVTKRSPGIRMGRGKGAPFNQICLVSKGQLLFEFRGPRYLFAKKIFEKASRKLPIKSVLVSTRFE